MDCEPKSLDLVVSPEEAGQRLDFWLAQKLPGTSRSSLQKQIAQQLVLLNGKACKASTSLVSGDRVVACRLAEFAAQQLQLIPAGRALEILYEDADLIVVNKPAGLSVHPGAGAAQASLVASLLAHNGGFGGEGDVVAAQERPGVVHRLDKDTSGVLVWAKNPAAQAALAQQFKEKTNKREYLALVDGVLQPPQLSFASYLRRDPQNRLRFLSLPLADVQTQPGPQASSAVQGKYALSHFLREEVYGQRLSLLRVRLATGRTHQIRVHCRALGLPILGDQLYHRPCELPQYFAADLRQLVRKLPRQMLHAHKLGFRHPRDGRVLEFTAAVPVDFATLLGRLRLYQTEAS